MQTPAAIVIASTTISRAPSALCFASATEDAGPLDLRDMLGVDDSAEGGRKKPVTDRSS